MTLVTSFRKPRPKDDFGRVSSSPYFGGLQVAARLFLLLLGEATFSCKHVPRIEIQNQTQTPLSQTQPSDPDSERYIPWKLSLPRVGAIKCSEMDGPHICGAFRIDYWIDYRTKK